MHLVADLLAMGPISIIVVIFLGFFILGVVDIGRNGPSPKLLSKKHRAGVNAKNAGGPLVTAAFAIAIGLVGTGTVAVIDDPVEGPSLRISTDSIMDALK